MSTNTYSELSTLGGTDDRGHQTVKILKLGLSGAQGSGVMFVCKFGVELRQV